MGAAALAVVNSGISLVSLSAMLAGGISVVVMNVSAMRPAVSVVGKFPRGPVCGEFSVAATLMAVAVDLPELLVDGLLDEFN